MASNVDIDEETLNIIQELEDNLNNFSRKNFSKSALIFRNQIKLW